jgi:hypothetical protein
LWQYKAAKIKSAAVNRPERVLSAAYQKAYAAVIFSL